MSIPFEVLYNDDHMVAINKPPGILVHRTKISEDKIFVLQLLRDQIGQRVFPVHRLDRGTSGVLLFAKNAEIAGELSELMRTHNIRKRYLGVVRGYLDEAGTIDYPLQNQAHLPPQEAITHYKTIAQVEKNFFVNRYPTSRYSLLEITLETGRRHQIRRHLAHLRHPIIGDKKHGDCKHNKYFRDELGVGRMLLHAKDLSLIHPKTEAFLQISASTDELFDSVEKWFS